MIRKLFIDIDTKHHYFGSANVTFDKLIKTLYEKRGIQSVFMNLLEIDMDLEFVKSFSNISINHKHIMVHSLDYA